MTKVALLVCVVCMVLGRNAVHHHDTHTFAVLTVIFFVSAMIAGRNWIRG